MISTWGSEMKRKCRCNNYKMMAPATDSVNVCECVLFCVEDNALSSKSLVYHLTIIPLVAYYCYYLQISCIV